MTHHHLAPAQLAHNVGLLIGDLHFGALHVLLGALQHIGKVIIEVVHHAHPFGFSLLYLVQLTFHLGGKFHIYYLAKLLLHQAGHRFPYNGGL